MLSTIFPLIKHYRATTFLKAFILNAIATAAIAALAIEMRMQLNNKYSKTYGYFNDMLMKHELSEFDKIFIVFVTGFLGAVMVYHLMYMFVAYGGGLLAPQKFKRRKYY
jgi:hypothetical protein